MTWSDLLTDWHDHIDRLIALFPHADPVALARFRGNRELLAEYIADTHDLTLSEGREAIETRLLTPQPHCTEWRRLMAAE